MLRTSAILLLCVATGTGLYAQENTPDPLRHFASREALAELLVRWEGAANSSAYSEELRQAAAEEAEAIRTRLDQGDFKVGDRIYLQVLQDSSIRDTFVVDAGPIIDLPSIGAVSLAGVLRIEVEPYLTEQIARFVRQPTVRARALLQVLVTGGVNQPGPHTFPSTATLADVLRASGVGNQTDLDDMQVERNDVVLLSGPTMQAALSQGLTLDQLGIREGDELNLPVDLNPNRRLNSEQMVRTVMMVISLPFAVMGMIRTF